jgi:hypothetical protein
LAFKDIWKDKVDNVDDVRAEDINAIANEAIRLDNDKIDKIDGMGLSQNSFTDEEKEKLARLENGGGISADDIVDNLNSTDTDKALSANQGRILNDKITTEETERKSSVAELQSYCNSVFGGFNDRLIALDRKIKPDVITSINGTTLYLYDNQDAQLGEIASLVLAMPENVEATYYSSFNFKSGEEPTVLSYSSTPIIWCGDDCDSDGVFVPEANTVYEVSIKNLGTNGIVARVGVV